MTETGSFLGEPEETDAVRALYADPRTASS